MVLLHRFNPPLICRSGNLALTTFVPNLPPNRSAPLSIILSPPFLIYIRGPGTPARPGDWPRRSISGTVSVGVQPRLSLHTKRNDCKRARNRSLLTTCKQAHYSPRVSHVYN